MNWTKPNFAQWVTILTVTGSLIGYAWHAESERVKGEIEQHDLRQKVDSINTAFTVFMSEFRDLQKNRVITTKQRDQEKQQDDERIQGLNIRLTIMETKWSEFLFYNHKK